MNKQGLPVFYSIYAGSSHDITAFQHLNINLPENSFLYVDSGYLEYNEEGSYQEIENIHLKIARKSNSLRKDTPVVAALKDAIRKQAVRRCDRKCFCPNHSTIS